MVRAHVALTVFLVSAHSYSFAQTPPATLEGTAWKAVELYGTAVPPQPAAREPHLIFAAAGRVSGSDGCNRVTGTYATKDNGLTFSQIAATRMLCPKIEDVAQRFHNALKGTSHWSLVKGRLEMYGATGKPLAVFERRQAEAPAAAKLQGTAWRLVKFSGGDDRTLTPDDRDKYTIEFAAGGRLTVRLDCNRGRGTWKSGGPGQVQFGPMALTRAMCAQNSLHDQMAKQWSAIRSYVIKDGHLFLALMADGGIYEFEPVAPKK